MRSPILALLAPLIASFALQTLAAPQPPVAKQPGNEAAGDKAAHLKPQAKVHSPPARAKPATYGQQHSPLSLGGRPLQKYPKSARPAGTFSNGAAALIGEPDQVNVDVSAIAPEYQAREIDLPFGRLQKGGLKFFSHTNVPGKDQTVFGKGLDHARQSACGIPFNAFFVSTVAIHPYWLKYAGLDRYCMQDVCISFWQSEGGKNDMMLKVTDICSTDPKDPTHCSNPSEIKIDRQKAWIINQGTAGKTNVEGVNGDSTPYTWFFMKCWADGLAQPAYLNNPNKPWFLKPELPNNVTVMQDIATQQWKNNQKSYPTKGWPTYENGMYRPFEDRDKFVFHNTDWVPGKEPKWQPLAGGAQCTG